MCIVHKNDPYHNPFFLVSFLGPKLIQSTQNGTEKKRSCFDQQKKNVRAIGTLKHCFGQIFHFEVINFD